jgi:hypothetical protein
VVINVHQRLSMAISGHLMAIRIGTCEPTETTLLSLTSDPLFFCSLTP